MDANIDVVAHAWDRDALLASHGFLKAVRDRQFHKHILKTIVVEPSISIELIIDELKSAGLEVIYHTNSKRVTEVVFNNKAGSSIELMSIALTTKGRLDINVYSNSNEAHASLEDILKRLDKYRFENKETTGVWAEFSFMSPHGISRNSSFLRCPVWDNIRSNYVNATRSKIDEIINDPKPWEKGRLLIWYGPPGTGKTYAIRSLMMAWREHFNFLVVTDPENLVRNPGYYYETASESGSQPQTINEPADEDLAKKRVLFVLEDSADLIIEESRARANTGEIGKLLNMTDGLFGQGREDIFLVTFNEDLQSIDPAFLRPGRCMSKVNFETFNQHNANQWLIDHGINPTELGSNKTLAELYAIQYGKKFVDISKKSVGFNVK